MKYQAPPGVTSLCCAGETITPDEAGVFEAAGYLAGDLSAHGCVVITDVGKPAVNRAGAGASRGRPRSEKAN